MKRDGFLARADVIEVALSNVAFAAMQIYIPWLAALHAPQEHSA